MSSPTLTAFDIFLISLGIAPLKILIAMYYSRRKRKRDEYLALIYQRKIDELQKRYKDKL